MNVSTLFEEDSGKFKSVMFDCPGCKLSHSVFYERPAESPRPIWTWNGSLEKPTFSPSVNVRWHKTNHPPTICHSFVRDGNIEFLYDCTHELAGKTVPLPVWED